jgi:hypothetical protein
MKKGDGLLGGTVAAATKGVSASVFAHLCVYSPPLLSTFCACAITA